MPRGREHAQAETVEVEETPSPPGGRSPNPAVDPEAYLRWHGWQVDADGFWPDPLGTGGPSRQVPIGEKKNDRGEVEIIYQTVVPPIAWAYSLREAVELQQLRDEAERK